MKRALPVALLGALALAGSAAAAPPPAPSPVPYVHGTVIGGTFPIRVTAGLTPPVVFFGDKVTATVNVLADRKWIDPARLKVFVRFAPYRPIGAPTRHETDNGRLIDIQWTWTLRCLTTECVPVVPPSDTKHVFRLPPAVVRYLDAKGNVAWSVGSRFPTLEELSTVSPAIQSYATINKRVKWQYQLAPAAVQYRISPAVVFWLAVLLAAVCAAAALAVVTRWVVQLRNPAPAVEAPQGSSLEQALALFFWAGRHDDETLQRKALERVAAELPIDVAELSDLTRQLAWSSELPEEDEVEAISAQAGVPAHHENGTGQ